MSGRGKRQPLETVGKWKPGTYLEAVGSSVRNKHGLLHAGLALRKLWDGSPKGRRPPMWSLTHCGSGHAVCNIAAHLDRACEIASKIALLTDWEAFDSPVGFQNTDPELPNKMRQFADSQRGMVRFGGGGPNLDTARAVAEARA